MEKKWKRKKYNNKGKLIFEGEYFNGNKWNGKGYDENGKTVYELKNGKGYVKEYFFFMKFKSEGTEIFSVVIQNMIHITI